MDGRAEFVETLSAQIVAWDVQIDFLKDKTESATPEEKFEYSRVIAALELKRNEAAEKLQGISVVSEDESS
jgi:hypothetical protein